MIDPTTERLLSLPEAARTLPEIDGKQPHPSTLFRWISDGIRGGVKLEHVRLGRRICTTEAALTRFMNEAAQAEPAPRNKPQKPRTRSEKAREKAVEAARARLEAQGAI